MQFSQQTRSQFCFHLQTDVSCAGGQRSPRIANALFSQPLLKVPVKYTPDTLFNFAYLMEKKYQNSPFFLLTLSNSEGMIKKKVTT